MAQWWVEFYISSHWFLKYVWRARYLPIFVRWMFQLCVAWKLHWSLQIYKFERVWFKDFTYCCSYVTACGRSVNFFLITIHLSSIFYRRCRECAGSRDMFSCVAYCACVCTCCACSILISIANEQWHSSKTEKSRNTEYFIVERSKNENFWDLRGTSWIKFVGGACWVPA